MAFYRKKSIHQESLLNIPLVEQMLLDPQVELVPRSIDAYWRYTNLIPQYYGGFNPWSGKVFFAQKSKMFHWLKNPEKSARTMNENDILTYEVLFAVHDYLHVWAYLAINHLMPDLGIGRNTITQNNFEDFVFCHLLSEAVAVTGLDYWQLSVRDVNSYAPIGSRVGPVTVSYYESDMSEYKKLSPDFAIQKPEHLAFLTHFYCSGDYYGFDLKDLKKSPMLQHWLQHEITYGEHQRAFTRSWFNYLSDGTVKLPNDSVYPVAIEKKWKKDLIKKMSILLWEKVKENKIHKFSPLKNGKSNWSASDKKNIDYRFVNINSFKKQNIDILDLEPQKMIDTESYLKQLITSYDYESLDKEYVKIVLKLYHEQNVHGVKCLLKGKPKILSNTIEIHDLMVLS